MANSPSIRMSTAARLRELLNYDPATGFFTRRISTNTRWKVGTRAGTTHKHHGYRLIEIDKHKYFEHRLAWLYMIGEWPKNDIDHINNIRDDNRFFNLREATRQQNCWNSKRKNTKNLYKGITFMPKNSPSGWRMSDCWASQIRIDGGNKFLGYFGTPEEAHNAYRQAAVKHFGEFASWQE